MRLKSKHMNRRLWGSFWDLNLLKFMQKPHKKLIEGWSQRFLSEKIVAYLGCGVGSELDETKKIVSFQIGFDLAPEQIRIAKSVCPFSLFIICDVDNLPIRKKTLGAVYCKSILHHLPNILVTLQEIIRTLRDKGVLFIYHEPGLLNPIALIGRTFFPTNIHTPYERPFVPNNLRKIIQKKGFVEVYFKCFYLFILLLPILGKHLNKFGKNILKKLIIIFSKIDFIVVNYSIFRELCWTICGIYII